MSIILNFPVANDINEMVSDLETISGDQLSPIVASGRTGSGNLTAALQVQGGANISDRENVNNSPLEVEYCVTVLSLAPIPSDLRAHTCVQFNSFYGTTYFNDNNSVGGIITKVREPRLAIEDDVHLLTIPSASLCLSDFQYLPNDMYVLCY